MIKEYSIERALEYLINPDLDNPIKPSEIQKSDNIHTSIGTKGGVFIPLEAPYKDSLTFLDGLKEKSIFLSNGATIIPNLKRDLPITDKLTLSKNFISSTILFSKAHIKNKDYINYIFKLMFEELGRQIDKNIIHGNEKSKPGLFKIIKKDLDKNIKFENINPTSKELIELETIVANKDNIDEKTTVYISNPNLRGNLKTTRNNLGQFIKFINENGLVNGYKYITTNTITKDDNRFIFGDLSNIIVGFWGGINIALGFKNTIVVTMYYDYVIDEDINFSVGEG